MMTTKTESEERCPKCGEIIRPVKGDKNFDFRPGGKVFVVSGLEKFTYCDCGIELDSETKDLLHSLNSEPYRWEGTYGK